jgi:hypothetical protein
MKDFGLMYMACIAELFALSCSTSLLTLYKIESMCMQQQQMHAGLLFSSRHVQATERMYPLLAFSAICGGSCHEITWHVLALSRFAVHGGLLARALSHLLRFCFLHHVHAVLCAD